MRSGQDYSTRDFTSGARSDGQRQVTQLDGDGLCRRHAFPERRQIGLESRQHLFSSCSIEDDGLDVDLDVV